MFEGFYSGYCSRPIALLSVPYYFRYLRKISAQKKQLVKPAMWLPVNAISGHYLYSLNYLSE